METEFFPSVILGKTGLVRSVFQKKLAHHKSSSIAKISKKHRSYKERRKHIEQGLSQQILDTFSYTKNENGTRQNYVEEN